MQGAERPTASSPSHVKAVIAIILVLYCAGNLASRAIDLYHLKEREADLARTNATLAERAEQKAADIRYFSSDSFAEKMAKLLFGWGRPTEKMLPASVAPAPSSTQNAGRVP